MFRISIALHLYAALKGELCPNADTSERLRRMKGRKFVHCSKRGQHSAQTERCGSCASRCSDLRGRMGGRTDDDRGASNQFCVTRRLAEAMASFAYSSSYGRERSTIMTTQGNNPSFARDIQPLFRARDRASMSWAFDLWDYHDVSTHAQAILGRLSSGTMPCDGKWPEEQIAQFRRWVEAGMPA